MGFLSSFSDFLTFNKCSENSITFFAERCSDFCHYEDLIRELATVRKVEINYIASTKNDPFLDSEIKNVNYFLISSNMIRIILFTYLKNQIFITTMPDLDTFHLKRSENNVYYIYLFHSIVSTHMIYRSSAFDAYDSIFCVGQHHNDEILKQEELRGLKPKKLFNFGYSRLDQISQNRVQGKQNKQQNEKVVLVAPTWGPNSIPETCGVELVNFLINSGFFVIFRPHPDISKNALAKLERLANKTSMMVISSDKNTAFNDFEKADVMVSDWSGVAFEYSFGFEKPVIFIDVPKKINNKEFTKFDMKPLEDFIRADLGVVLREDQLSTIGFKIRDLLENFNDKLSVIKEAREKYIYNLNNSTKVGVDEILSIFKERYKG